MYERSRQVNLPSSPFEEALPVLNLDPFQVPAVKVVRQLRLVEVEEAEEAEEGEEEGRSIPSSKTQKIPLSPNSQGERITSEGVKLLPKVVNTVVASPALARILEVPVGGRLQEFWESWEQMGVEQSVVTLIKEGYRLVLIERPPLTIVHRNIQLPMNLEKRNALLNIVQELLRDRVIERVKNIQSPGYYNHFFITPKSTPGKWRPILDLKQFNNYMLKERFKMETAESIRASLQQGDWATSLDFTSAYHHIPIHASSRKFLRFAINDQVFQYRALPMGLTSSARIFTKVIKCVQGLVQKEGIHLHQYLDDWLVRAQSKSVVEKHTE